MSETTLFTIRSEVFCSDGSCGELRRVIIDTLTHTLTHLVVEPKHARQGGGRLVPFDLVLESTKEIVRLRCTMAIFEALEPAEETEFLPETIQEWTQEPSAPLFHGLGMSTLTQVGPQTVSYDRVPLGEFELRREQHVHAKDGSIGHLHGLFIDPGDHHVSHFIVDEGHLWGQKRVAIPINAVERIDDDIWLNLTKRGAQLASRGSRS